MTKAKKAEQEEARERLRGWLKPGDTVFCILRHRSRSGMMRVIDLVGVKGDGAEVGVRAYGYNAALAVGMPFDRDREGVKVGGCGMDMGFHLVYELSYALWPDGFGCVGEGCPSSDHSHGDRDYTPHGHRKPVHVENDPDALKHWHTDGGYALRHRWL